MANKYLYTIEVVADDFMIGVIWGEDLVYDTFLKWKYE